MIELHGEHAAAERCLAQADGITEHVHERHQCVVASAFVARKGRFLAAASRNFWKQNISADVPFVASANLTRG
jgi:hypothetical protein